MDIEGPRNIMFILVIIGFIYALVFIIGKRNIAGFEVRRDTVPIMKGSDIPVAQDAGADPWTKPYTTRPIQKVDDYEHDVIFNNEGDRQMSKTEINEKMRLWPFDWASLPLSAAQFQEKQQEWMLGLQKTGPVSTAKYATIENFEVLPPDTKSLEEQEMKLLQTYVPACSKDLKYDVEDAKTLINKIYEKKGQRPLVHQREDGVYEVFETQELNPKIVYEDDAEASTSRMSPADYNAATFEVPQEARDLAAGLDPFFESSGRTRAGRTDYTQWTPGLERSFAPTYPRTNWY